MAKWFHVHRQSIVVNGTCVFWFGNIQLAVMQRIRSRVLIILEFAILLFMLIRV